MTLRTGRQHEGDDVAMMAASGEPRAMLYQRFTEAQHAACVAAGWRFAGATRRD